MPAKRRKTKRRVTPEAEAMAWATYWECGYDFFGEAAELCGLPEPTTIWPLEARAEAERKWEAGSNEARQRVGHLITGSEAHAS